MPLEDITYFLHDTGKVYTVQIYINCAILYLAPQSQSSPPDELHLRESAVAVELVVVVDVTVFVPVS